MVGETLYRPTAENYSAEHEAARCAAWHEHRPHSVIGPDGRFWTWGENQSEWLPTYGHRITGERFESYAAAGVPARWVK